MRGAKLSLPPAPSHSHSARHAPRQQTLGYAGRAQRARGAPRLDLGVPHSALGDRGVGRSDGGHCFGWKTRKAAACVPCERSKRRARVCVLTTPSARSRGAHHPALRRMGRRGVCVFLFLPLLPSFCLCGAPAARVVHTQVSVCSQPVLSFSARHTLHAAAALSAESARSFRLASRWLPTRLHIALHHAQKSGLQGECWVCVYGERQREGESGGWQPKDSTGAETHAAAPASVCAAPPHVPRSHTPRAPSWADEQELIHWCLFCTVTRPGLEETAKNKKTRRLRCAHALPLSSPPRCAPSSRMGSPPGSAPCLSSWATKRATR